MTKHQPSSVVPVLLALLVQCGTHGERSGTPGSAGANGSAGRTPGGAGSAGVASGAFGGAGGSSGSTAARGGAGAGGTTSNGFGGGGVAGSFGTAGAGASAVPSTLTLASTAVPVNGAFAPAYTCSGGDTSPDLEWAPGASGALSYAVTLVDAGTGVPQWIVWDIPASVTSLPAGLPATPLLATPAGAKQVSTSGGGYVGPCPSPGQQRFYEFEVYALPVATLAGVTTQSGPSAVATAINLTPPIDLAVFGASAGMANGGAAGSTAAGGSGGTTSM
jgi:phosphatidylethanolamine-binding protein (PEBP) family uncharacterized protein